MAAANESSAIIYYPYTELIQEDNGEPQFQKMELILNGDLPADIVEAIRVLREQISINEEAIAGQGYSSASNGHMISSNRDHKKMIGELIDIYKENLGIGGDTSRYERPRTGRGLNPWIAHVKKVQKQKGISYKEAMKIAKQTY